MTQPGCDATSVEEIAERAAISTPIVHAWMGPRHLPTATQVPGSGGR